MQVTNEIRRAYWDNAIYQESKNLIKIEDGIVVTEYFNPLHKIITTLINLIANNLSIDNDKINEVWNLNNMNQFHKKMLRELCLMKAFYLEVAEQYYVLHSIDDELEVVEEAGELLVFKFSGTKKFVDESGEIAEETITKKYYRNETGIYLQIDEEAPTKLPYEDFPVIKFKTTFDIDKALILIDRLNELEAKKKKVEDMHGAMPILFGKNWGEKRSEEEDETSIIKKTLEALDKAKHKFMRVIHTKEASDRKSEAKFLELNTQWIQRFNENQEETRKELKQLFPELAISDKTGNIALETFMLTFQDLRARVNDIRGVFLNNLKIADSISSGVKKDEIKYRYYDLFEEREKQEKLKTNHSHLENLKLMNEVVVEESLNNTILQQVESISNSSLNLLDIENE